MRRFGVLLLAGWIAGCGTHGGPGDAQAPGGGQPGAAPRSSADPPVTPSPARSSGDSRPPSLPETARTPTPARSPAAQSTPPKSDQLRDSAPSTGQGIDERRAPD